MARLGDAGHVRRSIRHAALTSRYGDFERGMIVRTRLRHGGRHMGRLRIGLGIR